MSPDSLKSKQLFPRIGRWLIGLAVLFLAGHFVLNFVTTGTLDVTTGSSATNITVTSMPTHGEDKAATAQKGAGSLTIRLHAGEYALSVQNGALQTNQSVNVGWLSHKQVNLSPSGGAAIEPVLYESVQNVAADGGTRMIYLNNDFNGIEYINSDNEDTSISGNQYFNSVEWADTEYGVAQDRLGKLYVVDGNAAHPLRSPISNISNVSGTAFAVASNRTIYIGFGSDVYRGTEKGGFKQIFNGFSSLESLVAANDKVMIINPGSSGVSGTATIISTNGHEIHKNFGYPLGGWTPWSPGGQNIVLTVGSEPELFDSSLNRIGIIPQPGIVKDGAWLNDNTLFYHSADQLWSYNVSQNEANLLATVPNQKLIQGISVSTDGSYVYITTSNNNSSYPRAVFRVGLRGQDVPAYMNTLGAVLPISGSTYSIGLRNFSGTPTVDVTTYPGSDTNVALQAAQDAMQGIVNINDINFDVEPGD